MTPKHYSSDEPWRDYSYMDEQRSKRAARRVLVIGAVAYALLMVWLVMRLAQ